MATKPTGKMNSRYGGRWDDPEKDELLTSLYGTINAGHIANRLNSKFGTRFTGGAVYERAWELGLNASDCQGLLTITQAARELGITDTRLCRFLARTKLPTIGRGKFTFLTEETWAAAQVEYPPLPEACVSAPEAARRLNFTLHAINKMTRRKALRGHKVGRLWFIPLVDVERMEREQRGARRIGD